MRIQLLIAALLASVAGCDEESEFECVGTCVTGVELSLPNGRRHDGPMPQPTTTGSEPVITWSDWVPVNRDTFALELHVASAMPVSVVYLEINDAVYEIEAEAVAAPSTQEVNACNLLVESQGITCSAACLEACGCATCSDVAVEKNLTNACALNCSVQDHQGLIGPEPFTSEAVFADLLYSGDASSGLPGMLAQLPGCSGQICFDRAASSKRQDQRLQLKFHFRNDSFVPNLNVGTLSAIADPPNDTPYVSESVAAPAKINLESNGCLR